MEAIPQGGPSHLRRWLNEMKTVKTPAHISTANPCKLVNIALAAILLAGCKARVAEPVMSEVAKQASNKEKTGAVQADDRTRCEENFLTSDTR